MTYQEALDFLYVQLPVFQRVGAEAYKPGLGTSIALAEAFDNPHHSFKSIHVGGTNGKGSTSHTLAAILNRAGYNVGLYTSPHLVDFRERIRVNGEMISREEVVDFVERYLAMKLDVSPSFFELTMMMAFEFFKRRNVDVAVIEVGLGGRLDSTNIITPELAVITNISFDHQQFLGDTLEKIASEKAGIIKPGIPVVIGESAGEVRRVFTEKASAEGAPIFYADDAPGYSAAVSSEAGISYHDTPYGEITGELAGECQKKNTATILNALDRLQELGWRVTPQAVREGFAHVCSLTGLMGRWMKTGESPLVVCDTGHNSGGWEYLSSQIASCPGTKHIVIGFVNDKAIDKILGMMPKENVRYYFTRASVARALPAEALAVEAAKAGLSGSVYERVEDAVDAATGAAAKTDTVFIGGSTFVVADYLASR